MRSGLGHGLTKTSGAGRTFTRDGLVAYYPFNSNSADDKSTNTNNGTVKSGRALAFDGVVDFLTVYDDASLNIGTSDFTVAAWVKLDYSSLPLTDNPALVRYGGGWNNSNPGFSCLWSTSAVPYLQFSSSSGTPILGIISGASAFTADTWYRTVWVFDRDGNFQLYVNGSASGNAIDISNGSASISPSKNMYIGGVTALPDYPFSGVISDYQFWHSAWSSTDVTNDYTHPEMLAHTFSGTSLTESNLKAWLPMSEGNPESPQTTIFDGSGNKNHATSVFYGDEMWDGEQGDDANWLLFGTNTKAEDDGAVKITYDNNASGGYIMLRDASDLNDDLVVGRTYIISFSTKVNQGSITWRCLTSAVGGTNDTATAITSTEFEPRTMTVVANHSTDMYIHSNGMGTGDIVWVKDLSVKEVGLSDQSTAMGQETIFQPAFVGQNRMSVFNGIDGSDEYAEVSDTDELDMGTGNFTLSAWVCPQDWVGKGYILSKGSAGSNGYAMQLDINRKLIGRWDSTSNNESGTSGTAVSQNIWSHVVCSFDRDEGLLSNYINGSLDSTHSMSGDTGDIDTASPFTIGVHSLHGDNAFRGFINEISVWKGTALSLAQVQELYNDGVALDLESNTLTDSPTLTGYWRNNKLHTDGTWKDLSSNRNRLTVNGSPSTVIFPEGITSGRDINGFFLTHPNNNYLSLDGTDDSYLEVSHSDALNFGTGDFTIECWAKAVDWDYDTSNDTFMVCKWADSNNYWYLRTDSSKYVQFYSKVGGSAKNSCTDDTALNANTWYHICFVANRGGNGIIYLNGASADTTDISGDSSADYSFGGSLYIGRYVSASSFNGQIDDVRIYKRALSASEVTRNYKHGSGKHKD